MIVDIASIYASRKQAEGFGDEEFLLGLGDIVDSASNNAAYIDEGPMVEAAGFNGSLDGGTQDFYLAVKTNGGFNL